MSSEARARSAEFIPFERIREGREIIRQEAEALMEIASRLGVEFSQAVDLVCGCEGSVIVTGVGKAGLIGQKIAATMASTGTRSHFLHPTEAFHGDLGRIGSRDVVLALSYSGETEEVVRLLPILREADAPIVAVTSSRDNALGRGAEIVLPLGTLREACPLGLAPSVTTTAMLAVGDALALVSSRLRGFRKEDFARFHPGGSLGRKLSKVEDEMRPREECRIAEDSITVRRMLVQVSRPGRRTGAVMLVDPQGMLTGLFTDSDLAKLLEHRDDQALDQPVGEVMTPKPCAVELGSLFGDAVQVMGQRKISELPVVDHQGKPAGIIDVTDVLFLIPSDQVG
ncbi:MAG: KpsF/GutQ family sugar-phosphate isomerase [Planctomycetales bacterium]